MARLTGKENVPGSEYRKIMSLRPDLNKAWNTLDEAIRFAGVLDAELKEEVRRMVAQNQGCKFCASLGLPKDHYEDPRVAAAVAFAGALASSPTGISDEVWAEVRPHFNDEELVELVAWTSFMYAAEMFGAVMKVDAATPEMKAQYSTWIARGIEKSRRASAAA
jgi:alkylhydroperoxidase family enzyme